MKDQSYQIPFIKSENGTVYYSLVEKQSQLGMQYNERLLVLMNQKFIGYISNPNKKKLSESAANSKPKISIPIRNLRNTVPKGNQLTLLINQHDKDKKLKSIKWVFRMKDAQQVARWVQLIQKQNSPYTSRKDTLYVKPQEQFPTNQNKLQPTVNQITEGLRKKGYTQVEQNHHQKNRGTSGSFQQNYEEKSLEIQKIQNKNQNNPKIADLEKHMNKKKQLNNQSALSKILDQNVDYKKVEQEYQIFKKSMVKQKAQPLNAFSSDIHVPTQHTNFYNYFRPPPLNFTTQTTQINDSQYESFIHFCSEEIKKILKEKTFEEGLIQENWHNKGVSVKLYTSEMKQIPGNKSVCDQGSIKTLQGQKKNMDYLWKIIAGDSQLNEIFKMPMSCIVQYMGYVAFFTCQFDKYSTSNSLEIDYSYYFQKLSALTKVHRNALQNKEYLKFVKVGKVFVIYEVSEYLPRFINNATMMRPQMFEKIYQKSSIQYQLKKGKREEEQQIKIFTPVIENSIESLAFSLEKLEEYVLHPKQFTIIFHKYGLNINMMHKICEKVNNIFMKNVIKTEAVIRAVKMLFRRKIQEQSPSNCNKIILKFLNTLFSDCQTDHQSQNLYQNINTHAKNYFQMTVQQQEINKGYFLLGLEHHLGLIINLKRQHLGQNIKAGNIFQINNIVNDIQFVPKIKCCHFLNAHDIEAKYEQYHACQLIVNKFSLHKKNLPFYVTNNQQFCDKILNILSQFYGPQKFPQLKIYDLAKKSSQLTLSYHQRRITHVKWQIKAGTISQANVSQHIFDTVQQLQYYYNNMHPYFTELYDLLFAFYLSQQKYENALQASKDSLSVMIQLCGGKNMHIKLASNYYQMGDCYNQWKKYDDAIAYYKKSKNILQFNQYISKKQYGYVLLKLAVLYLYKFKDQQAEKLLQTSLAIFQNQHVENYSQIVQILELITRCSLHPQQKQNVFHKSLKAIKLGIDCNIGTDQQFLKLIKLILINYFSNHNKQISLDFIMYIEGISDFLRLNVIDTDKSLEIIKQYIINNKFIDVLSGFTEKSKVSQSKKNPVETNQAKDIEIFQNLIKNLITSTSQGFMLGVLNECHK